MPDAFFANLIHTPSDEAWLAASQARHAARSPNGSGSSTEHRLAEQRPRDDEALDLRGALVDLGDLGVAVVALGRELLRVAIAAEDLDRLARLAAGDGRCEQLGLRALDGVRAAGLLEPRRAPH